MSITSTSRRMAALDLLEQRVRAKLAPAQTADVVLLVAFHDADPGDRYVECDRKPSEIIACASASGAKALCAQGGIDCVVVDVDGLDDYAPHFIHALSADAPHPVDVVAAAAYLPRGLADQLHNAGARTVVRKTAPVASANSIEHPVL
ncbi:MAG: hypothetical protein AAF683_03725 [Pseudomonadota bacterium]